MHGEAGAPEPRAEQCRARQTPRSWSTRCCEVRWPQSGRREPAADRGRAATPTSATAVSSSRRAASSAPGSLRTIPTGADDRVGATVGQRFDAQWREDVELQPIGTASLHVAAQRHQREYEPVQVVVDVEVAGKARAREPRLVPSTVITLRRDEIGDAPIKRR